MTDDFRCDDHCVPLNLDEPLPLRSSALWQVFALLCVALICLTYACEGGPRGSGSREASPATARGVCASPCTQASPVRPAW